MDKQTEEEIRRRLEAKLDGMSPAKLKQIADSVSVIHKKLKEDKLSLFEPNPAQIPICNSNKIITSIAGGNRCIAGSTMIWDPVANSYLRVDSIEGEFHVEAWDGEKRVVAKANRPFKKHVDDMYDMLFLPDLTTITVTRGHRFLIDGEWTTAGKLIDDYKAGVLPEREHDYFSGVRLSTFRHVGRQRVWDFEVTAYHNYFLNPFSNVLNHNSGKTEIAGFMVACHVTGRYPEWWNGYKFQHPINCAFIGPTADEMRRASQLKLFGEVDEFGTGYIPKECLIGTPSFKAQENGAIDTALIKHISGGTSRLIALTVKQPLKAFAGFQLDLGWFDEEPPFDKFDEARFRMLDRGGRIILSYCPQDMKTELIKHLDEDTPEEFIANFYLTPQDNPRLNQDFVGYVMQSTPDWLKESRIYGRPGTGDGKVFYFNKSQHVCEPFEVEPHWRVIGGFDPAGFGHHTAAVKLVIDDESKTVYVTAEYNAIEQLPPVHASALKRWGDMDFKIDTSSHKRESNGENLFDFYVKEGLNISNANKSLEVSLNLINMYLSEGRLLIFSTCKELINQMLIYRSARNNKTGEVKIVRKDNDVVDALRYAFMGLDEARVPGVNMKLKTPLPPVQQWKPFDARLGV